MAEIKSVGAVDLTVSLTELELIRRALKMSRDGYGSSDDMEPAGALLVDLSVMPS
jgi:hypothetical protein